MPRLVGDPGEIGAIREAAFLAVPDPANLFKARARRLEALSAGNSFAPFLQFMAALARAQDAAVAEACALSQMPVPFDREAILAAGDWHETLRLLAAHLDPAGMPDDAAAALRAVAARPRQEAAAFAGRVLDRRIIPQQSAEAVFLTAAMQIAWTRRAAMIPPDAVATRESLACLLCGAPPLASLVGAAGERQGLRYLVCSLCAAEWHYVRIKCTACGSTKGIDYHAVAGDAGPAKAEACSECNAYSKILYAEKDAEVELLADDLASLALDVLMADRGWRRAYPNPFLLSGVA